MPKVAPIQSSFNGGEFSPLMYGRVDLDRYKTGMAKCLNYIPTIQGGLIRRPGSYFIAETKFSTKKSRLFSFEFSITQAYMLEFGDQYMRVYKNDGLVTLTPYTIASISKSNPAVVTMAGAYSISNGNRIIIQGVKGMTEINNREYVVSGKSGDHFSISNGDGFSIDSTNYGTYTSGGTAAVIYEVSTPYLEADLFQIKITQSDDVLYIVHPSYAPRKLSRTGHTNWTLSTITFVDGPYLNTNTTSTTITPSAKIGTITLTASSATFAATDINRLIRIKYGSTWGYAQIVSFTSTTSVQAFVLSQLGDVTAVTTWRLGLWSDTTGYPGAVCFHEDRLCFGGGSASPQRFDGSRSSDYENFAPTDSDGTVTASHALGFSLNANDVNYIRWMASDEKGLLIGTVAGEWIVRPSAQSEALSPINVSAKQATAYGSFDTQPIQAGKATLFVQRYARKLREINYFYQVDGYMSSDMTILSEHVSNGGFVEIAYQKELQSIVWAVRADGTLVGATYERDLSDVKIAWHRHILGGYGDAAKNPARVESIDTIPATDGSYDELWMIVQRYVNGAYKRYVEVLTKVFEDTDELKDAFFVDAGLTYDNPIFMVGASQDNPAIISAVNHGLSNGDRVLISNVLGMTELNGNDYTIAGVTINTFQLVGIDSTHFGKYVSGGEVRKYASTMSGLYHLEGETVQILADGAVAPSQVVTHGAITLSQPATTVHIGMGYNSDGQILRIEAGSANGTALGKTRRINRIGILLYRSVGLKIGVDFDNLTTLVFRKTSDLFSRAVPLYSGILSENLEADYDFDNQFCWRQDQPLPSTVLAVMPQMVTEDRG